MVAKLTVIVMPQLLGVEILTISMTFELEFGRVSEFQRPSTQLSVESICVAEVLDYCVF